MFIIRFLEKATLMTYSFERPLLKYGFKGVFANIKSFFLQRQK